MSEEFRVLLIQATKDAILAKCDGGVFQEGFDGKSLYEMHGERLERFAEDIAKSLFTRLTAEGVAWVKQ